MRNKLWTSWINSKKINENQINSLNNIYDFITNNYPSLKLEIKWNQPMFSNNNTFIIGISISKLHISVAPEQECIKHFHKEIEQTNYKYTNNIIKISNDDSVNYTLLKQMIDYNIEQKQNFKTFFRSLNK